MSLKEFLKADIRQLRTTSPGKPTFVLFFTKKNFRIVLFYRILNYTKTKNRVLYYCLFPLSLYFRIMTNHYCIDLPVSTKIGAGFKLNHAYGIVINQRTVIGENAYIGHNVTIGSNSPVKYPIIGNNVTIYTGSIIIGDVTIGDNVIIGAGSLVVKSISSNTIVGGHPCKILNSDIAV